MRKLVILSVFFFLCISVAMPQPANKITTKNSNIDSLATLVLHEDSSMIIVEKPVNEHLTIISDSRIDTLLKIHREENIRKGGIDGFRVQVYRGKSKKDADRFESLILSKYPELEVHVGFPSPDFWTRVGDFRNKSEAIKLKYILEKDFPDAHIFIVDDIINPPCE